MPQYVHLLTPTLLVGTISQLGFIIQQYNSYMAEVVQIVRGLDSQSVHTPLKVLRILITV